MSSYMQKMKSPNGASANTAFASTAMTTPPRRTMSVLPNAPCKSSAETATNNRNVGGLAPVELWRTDTLSDNAQVDSYIMGPHAGQMLNIGPPQKKRFKAISPSVVSPSTEQLETGERIRSPTPVLGQTGGSRSRSHTLANINEVLSPRTDTAVRTLSVMNACDSEGNINNAQLNQRTLDEGFHKAAREQRLEELKNLEKSIREDRFSSQETTEYMKILDALRERVQGKSCIWDDAAFGYEEQVTLDHEDKSFSEITSLVGSSEVLGLDLLELCSLPNFTVARVVQTTVGRIYHMTWNASPSVKLIVDEASGLIMFKRVNDDVEVPTEHPCQCGTMIPLTAQLCGKTRCDNESEEEESEDEAVEPLNRSLTPEPLPDPEVGATYVRKERDGSPYEWVATFANPITQKEFTQPGHRVVVRKLWAPSYKAVLFESKGGILSSDMAKSTDTFLYKAELSDFHRHMELSSSVEQTSGGSMSEQQSRSKLASLDALKRAQINATNSNNVPINDKKRKAVENPDDLNEYKSM